MCAALLLTTLGGCSTQRQLGSSKLFSRETVIGFYALAPGETSPGPLYQRVMTFSPTVVFIADASDKECVWSSRTLSAEAPGAIPPPSGVSGMDVGVVHVSQIVDLQRFVSDPEFRKRNLADAAASLRPWKVALLPEPVLAARVSDGFDDLARSLEQHGVVLALSPGQGYLRSRPVGSIGETAVRYLALPTDPAAAPVDTLWLNPAPRGGRYAILRAESDRMSWSLYDGEGKLLDLVTIRTSSRSEGASNFLLTSEATALMKYGNEEEPAQP